MSVVVVGSGNLDLVSQVERIPTPGETVLSTGFATHAGGKGNNQATAGAGDTFCGALAARLDEGADLPAATRFATSAAALSVRRAGAVPAIPTREEIDDFHRS